MLYFSCYFFYRPGCIFPLSYIYRIFTTRFYNNLYFVSAFVYIYYYVVITNMNIEKNVFPIYYRRKLIIMLLFYRVDSLGYIVEKNKQCFTFKVVPI